MINNDEVMKLNPMLSQMNMTFIETSANRYVVELPLESSTNHVGTVYAGALFTLAEFPFGMMFMQRFGMENIYPVVGNMEIRFTAPAMTDTRVTLEVSDERWNEIEEQTLSKGKYKIILPIELKDTNGTVVAKTEATYFSVKR